MSMRLRAGIHAGLVAASATLGALIAFGARQGATYAQFEDAGQALFTRIGLAETGPALSVMLGLVLHATWAIMWGVCFSVVATPLRGARLAGAALAFGALAWAVTEYALPQFLSLGPSSVLGTPRLALLYVLFAAALAVGMRLAPVRHQLD